MDPGSVFFVAFGIFVIAGTAMAAYAYNLFQVGVGMAQKRLWHDDVWICARRICLRCTPLLATGVLIPVHPIFRVGISVIVYLLHAHPLCVGYWSERVKIEKAERLRFKKNVDDWLAEWECQEKELPSD